MKYFEIFNIKFSKIINLDDLEEKYLLFQQKYHPDNTQNCDIEKSILINDAYETLKDPIKRYSYILRENKIDITNDEKAPKVDPQTLEEIWQIQENINKISIDDKLQLKKELKEKITNYFSIIYDSIQNSEFIHAAQILIKVKYYNKIIKNLK